MSRVSAHRGVFIDDATEHFVIVGVEADIKAQTCYLSRDGVADAVRAQGTRRMKGAGSSLHT